VYYLTGTSQEKKFENILGAREDFVSRETLVSRETGAEGDRLGQEKS
jgi:hypothetical protein